MVSKNRKILVLGGGDYARPFIPHGDVTLQDAIHFAGNPEFVDSFDLVVFTGGHDVSPSLYGQTEHTRTQSFYRRDASEQNVFNRCKEKGIKMVGICRGSQFLTVMNGGTLIQHVENHAMGGTHTMIVSDTGEEVQVTSTHHQMMHPNGVYRLLAYALGRSNIYEGGGNEQMDGDGLFTATDVGVLKEPEVVWYPDTSSLAAQYHPEYMGEDTEGYKYFQEVIQEYVL